MKKYSSWFLTLYALVFIAVPSVVGIFFLVNKTPNYGIVFGVAFAVLFGGNLLTFLAYKLNLLSIEAFNFVTPLTIVFFGLYATMYQHWWVMLLVVIAGIIIAFPVNMIVTKIKENKRYKALEKAKIEKSKRQ